LRWRFVGGLGFGLGFYSVQGSGGECAFLILVVGYKPGGGDNFGLFIYCLDYHWGAFG